MRKTALAVCAFAASLLAFAAPASAVPTPPGASKNVKLVDQLAEATDATAINFLQYKKHGSGHGSRRGDVMLVTGRFGLKSYSLARARASAPARRGDRRGPAPPG